jgi:hypothetical protein
LCARKSFLTHVADLLFRLRFDSVNCKK